MDLILPLNITILSQRIGANILLPAMVLFWGIVTTLQGKLMIAPLRRFMHSTELCLPGLVTSYSGLIACRFFLGLFEGEYMRRKVTTLAY